MDKYYSFLPIFPFTSVSRNYWASLIISHNRHHRAIKNFSKKFSAQLFLITNAPPIN